MIKLVIQDDEGKTTVVPLIRDEITVGRKEGNTIRLTERNVSRKHARILRNNGSVAVEDLNSYNGVRVNGSRIQGRVGLNVSDRIQIGDYLIELKADGAAVPGDAYGDETQPVETMQAETRKMPGSSPAVALPQVVSEDDATTKMQTPMTAMLPAAGMGAPGAAEAAMPAPAAETQPPARLVVLSTSLAGQEYTMTQPAMVIGRTEDNDVVVNHRSISRHHAKIVCENGRYAVVDLQSSNGVRVNGEEYSKVELRRGDVIDLGHVRLRFVEPGEDFLFGRDAHAVVVPRQGNRTLLYAAIAVVLIGAVAIFALTRGGGGGDEKSAATSNEGPDKSPSASDDPGAKAAKSMAAKEDIDKIKPLLEVANSAVDKEEWESAHEAAKKALEIQPDSQAAKDLAGKAKFELENQARYNEFKDAVKSKDYSGIAKTFDSIDADSIYKDQARGVHDQIRDAYVVKNTSKAKGFAKKRKCEELGELKESVADTWSEAEEALADIGCEERVADGSSSRKKPDKKPDKKSDRKPTKSYDAYMKDAKAAMMKNQYGKARRACDQALKVKSKDVQAAMTCGIAACKMKRASLAKKYQGMLPPSRKAAIRQICLKSGLSDFQ